MFYVLVNHHYPWLRSHHLGFLRLFLDVTFQTTFGTLLSFFIIILLGPRTIRWLRRMKIGDLPNFDQDAMNALMSGKKGTPTMGGILIVFAIGVTVLLLADLDIFYVRMALICLFWLGAVGAVDDWLKLTTHARAAAKGLPPGSTAGRQGLTSLEKILFQIGLSIILGHFTYSYAGGPGPSRNLYFPFFKDIQIPLTEGWFVFITVLVLTGSSNAVNLTDGLDGLAAGSMGLASFTFVILSLVAGGEIPHLLLPVIPATGQMAVIAGAMLGACVGFLWFNCNPAQVFMGDTGSLALGGLLGYIAIVIRQELLLLIVGGIFVAEAMSVMLQVSYFKFTKRRYGQGRRIFLMSPLHHHFQEKKWTENQVVVRFWLIGAMLAMMALATLKIR